jgi:hypothetical protein
VVEDRQRGFKVQVDFIVGIDPVYFFHGIQSEQSKDEL